jgi:hypothetical protein
MVPSFHWYVRFKWKIESYYDSRIVIATELFIGHTGIGDSRGIIHDFAGPYHIGVGHLAFSKPTKYLQLDPSKCFGASWDNGLKEGCDVYSKRMHNICCDNCHSHVAKCLNVMGYSKL